MWSLVHIAVVGLLHRKVSLGLMILAVAVGVGFQIPNAANLDGYTRELLRMGVSRDNGHVLITPKGAPVLQGAGEVVRRLEALPFVRGVATRVARPGVIFGGKEQMGVRVVGVSRDREDRLGGLCRRVATGSCFQGRGRQVLLGRQVAEELKAVVGSRVELVLPHQKGGRITLVQREFVIAGLLRGGGGFQADYDVLVEIDVLSELLGLRDAVTHIAAYVDDPGNAPRYARRIATLVPAARVKPWQEVATFVARAIAANRSLATISMAMVVAAVMIPVLALLYIHVLQQRREIAVLAAVGFRRLDLFGIYLLKAALVGLVGVGLGLGIGLGLTAYFAAHPLFSYSGFVVRPVLTSRAILAPTLVLFGATLLAGLAPALQAARANPSLTLRRE
ncbi:MAG: FtsX-like permease family protein [bacterium]